MHSRRELEAELVELTARAATLADHIQRAGRALDTQTIHDTLPELQDTESAIDLVAFKLDLIREVEQAVD